MNAFKTKEVFSLAWNDFKKNWTVLVGSFLIVFIINSIIGRFTPNINPNPISMEIIFPDNLGFFIIMSLLSFLIGFYFFLTMTKIFLKIVDGGKSKIGDLFSFRDLKKYFLSLGTNILSSLIITLPIIVIFIIPIGLYLLNIPLPELSAVFGVLFVIALIFSIYLSLSLYFAIYFSIENRYHLVKALKKSREMTKNNKMNLLGFAFLALILNILGMIPLMLGLLVTVPLTLLSLLHIYRQLDPEVQKNNNEKIDSEEIKIANENNS